MTSVAGSPSRTLPASAGMTGCGVAMLARPALRNCGLCAESCGNPSWAAAARGQVIGDD